MAHFMCVTCRTRLHTPDGPGHRFDEMCPDCGSALERVVGDLAGLVGLRAITSHDRTAEGCRAVTHHSLVDGLGDLDERQAAHAQARLDIERWSDGADAEAVALPRPETTC